jgi:uncharacterized protein YbjT (DUF2867 family)
MTIKTKEKIALVFGSTGLTGRELTNLLLIDDHYEKIKVFVRKSTGINHPKLIEIIDKLEDPEKIAHEISGDDLFCCLGTTMKKAGSRKAFEWVDLELPARIAAIGSKNSIRKYLVVSSLGANSSSGNFYMRTKGIMEKRVLETDFQQITILRPSMLLGNREEFRFGEKIGQVVFRCLSMLFIGPLRKYRAIEVINVAKAMIKLANSVSSKTVIESDEIYEIAK